MTYQVDRGGTLVSLLGRSGPVGLDRRRALDRQMGAALLPYNAAISDARSGAISDANTVAQSSGNPFLAGRMATEASQRAAAPLLAQRAQAQAQIVTDEISREEARRQAEAQRVERMVMAGLSAGAGGLSTVLQGIGGGQGTPGGPTSGLAGATMTGSSTAGPAALSGILARGPSPGVAAPQPQAAGAQAQPMAQTAAAPVPPSAASPAQPSSGGVAIAPGTAAERRGQAGDFGAMLQSGGGALASMFPGYGNLIGGGLGMFGSLLR